ncbi:MAG: superoxide dismutase, Ni, partial [Patescibacteria group bacterium]
MNFLRFVDCVFEPQVALAHCDIPCGIYDPHEAQMAVHTIIRMTSLIREVAVSSENPDFEERKKIISQIARLTKVKEDHAELVKAQVRIIWGDYFKPEHLTKYKDLHDLVFKIMKQASKVRQEVNPQQAQELLSQVQKFAQIYWETKDRKTVRVKSGYPTEGE